jgi:hypothetical protein
MILLVEFGASLKMMRHYLNAHLALARCNFGILHEICSYQFDFPDNIVQIKIEFLKRANTDDIAKKKSVIV